MPIETEPHEAKAIGNNLRVSWKHTTEVGRFIKGDSVEKAKQKLQKVVEKDLAVPYTKFDSDAGHKTGKGAGRYPVKSAEKVLELIENAESNAEDQGLNTDNLKVKNVITNQGPTFSQRQENLKSAHIKIIVGER
ncbi:MAG: 50S ribosomal protein L22 [Candidatus Nanohaloarchaea archaeon]